MENVHYADPMVEGDVHVLAERIDTVRNGLNQGFSSADAFFQHVADSRVEKGLLVGKVPVERSDADTRAFGHGLSRRLAANLQHQFDRCRDEALAVLLRVSSHRIPLESQAVALTPG